MDSEGYTFVFFNQNINKVFLIKMCFFYFVKQKLEYTLYIILYITCIVFPLYDTILTSDVSRQPQFEMEFPIADDVIVQQLITRLLIGCFKQILIQALLCDLFIVFGERTESGNDKIHIRHYSKVRLQGIRL